MNIVAITILSVALTALIGSLGAIAIYYRRKWFVAYDRQKQNLAVDLELATSEQLLQEMRHRPRTYLLLLPVNNTEEGCFGLTMEVHNIDPVSAAGIMKMAAALAEKELRKQGVEIPEMPDLGEPM